HSLFFSPPLPRAPRSTLFPYTTLFRSDPVDPDPHRPAVALHRPHVLDQRRQKLPPAHARTVPAHPPSVRAPRQRLRRSVTKFRRDRKSTRLNCSHVKISYAVFCLKKKK